MNNPTECQNEKYLLWICEELGYQTSHGVMLFKKEYKLIECAHYSEFKGMYRIVAIFKKKT